MTPCRTSTVTASLDTWLKLCCSSTSPTRERHRELGDFLAHVPYALSLREYTADSADAIPRWCQPFAIRQLSQRRSDDSDAADSADSHRRPECQLTYRVSTGPGAMDDVAICPRRSTEHPHRTTDLAARQRRTERRRLCAVDSVFYRCALEGWRRWSAVGVVGDGCLAETVVVAGERSDLELERFTARHDLGGGWRDHVVHDDAGLAAAEAGRGDGGAAL